MTEGTNRLEVERSLALHREVARRIEMDPEILDMARDRVRTWLEDGSVHRLWAEAWRDVLKGNLEEVVALITDPGDCAHDLRQTSPFAGVLDPRARWNVLRRHSAKVARYDATSA